MSSNLDSATLAQLEQLYLSAKVDYLNQKVVKRTEAVRIALGMLTFLFLLEVYMLSGCWTTNDKLPPMAITLLFVIPLVAMSAIVVMIIIGAFGKEPAVGVGNLADVASETMTSP